MESKLRILIILVAIVLCISIVQIHAYPKPRLTVFNVNSYGAKADGMSDNSQAFMKAWKDACQWHGWSRVLIPRGTYILNSGYFAGPCNGITSFFIKGIIKAPTDITKYIFTRDWIKFEYVNNLIVEGDGILDGQGASSWKYNDCSKNPHCLPLPTTLRLNFVINSRIQHIKSMNSKEGHISVFASRNINITDIKITAPGNSPNTDGIRIGQAKNIYISHTTIGTGDDCIAMTAGSQNIKMFNVTCGPGHGISIGSLGKSLVDGVKGIHLWNSTFINADNGVRIKTWAPSFPVRASNFIFENIFMDNIKNPIIIDQQYCPNYKCDKQAQSNVAISTVRYNNIWGTSSSKVAVSFKCSQTVPCRNVTLIDINLSYKGPRGPAIASCSNVFGSASGIQLPPGCHISHSNWLGGNNIVW